MSKLVVIKLGKGNLNDGFSTVTVQLWENNDPHPLQFTGSLPAAPEIAELYKRLQLLYQALYQPLRKRSLLEVESVGLNNIGEVDFSDICKQLCDRMNDWLNSKYFQKIDQQLRTRLSGDEEVRVILETNDFIVQRLPWHWWSFFEDYEKAEVAFGVLDYERVKLISKTPAGIVRILAVLGNSEGIDIQKDRERLTQLPDAETVFLIEPSRQELDYWLWDEQGWDILFFAGHSQTQENAGEIFINHTDSLTIPQLKNALKAAIARGLQLAIFNSCDGLGLATHLADLHIPQTIVMREAVPDLIAQEFLKYFLSTFSSGQSFYLAVRSARERLQGLEEHFPGASGLPAIFQNPAVEPPTWQALRGQERQSQTLSLKHRLQVLLLTSVVITGLLIGVRSLGIMQQWELSSFDQLMRLRPQEEPDKRLLVVTITEADIQAQKQRQGSSLSDEALDRLLQRLERYQPRAIGLDIYRDFPVESRYKPLATRLRQNDRFVAICKVSGGKQKAVGVAPPPEIPAERLGFSDVIPDRDRILRRQLLVLTPGSQSRCQANYAFSLQLARLYLEKEGIQLQINPNGYLQLGQVVFQPLESSTGGYQNMDARGHQILLNYRASPQVAQQVTLKQVFTHQFNPDWVKNRIVLIGVDAESIRDHFLTPYSTGELADDKVSGVLIHTYMVSHILSTVLDHRPLLWVLPQWGEAVWIWVWSLFGGAIALGLTCNYPVYSDATKNSLIVKVTSAAGRQSWLLSTALGEGIAVMILYGCCFVFLLKGGWVPLVPPALALGLTGGSIVVYVAFRTFKP